MRGVVSVGSGSTDDDVYGSIPAVLVDWDVACLNNDWLALSFSCGNTEALEYLSCFTFTNVVYPCVSRFEVVWVL